MQESQIMNWADRKIFDPMIAFMSNQKTKQDEKVYFRLLEEMYKENDELFKLSFGLYAALDAKTCALLTHISLLTAVVMVFYTAQSTQYYFRFVLAIELAAYLIATLICLRCIRFGTPSYEDDHADDAYFEISRRRTLYQIASDIAVVATSVLMIIVILHVFV